MTTSARIRFFALLIAPGLLVATASVVGMLRTTDLPTQLATHWGVDGTVDRMGDISSFVTIVALLVPGFIAGMVGFSISPSSHGVSRLFVRSILFMSAWFSVFISVAMYLGVQSQRGVADASTLLLSSVLAPLGIAFVVAVIAGAVVALAAPTVPATPGLSAEASTADLAAGERVYWAQTARSPRGVVAIPVGAMVLIVVLFTIVGIPPWVTLVVGLILASLLTMLAWRVVVDHRGLTVTGLFGFPRFHVPTETIVAAAAIEVSPFGQYGGWGIRLGRSGWGVIARAGSAIEVQRTNGSNFVVTVDDAETGAGLLSSLAARAR